MSLHGIRRDRISARSGRAHAIRALPALGRHRSDAVSYSYFPTRPVSQHPERCDQHRFTAFPGCRVMKSNWFCLTY
jgi:hypothetical protein